MKKIGLFCGTNTNRTVLVAKKIQDAFGKMKVDILPIEEAEKKDFESYDYIIAGTSTWFDGELPTCWDEILPELSTMDLKDKKVAIFGLGDQLNYSDNFVDGIGLLAEAFESTGARIVGLTSSEGYQFNQSKALKTGQFSGLAIDIENESEKTDMRIHDWVKDLKKEFV